METMTITKKLFEDLKKTETLLGCLITCGVDGWEDFDDAQEMYDDAFNFTEVPED